MNTKKVHLAVYENAAEMEVGHLLTELRTGRFTGTPFEVVTVAEKPEPLSTMGGLQVLPGALLADLDPAASDLLVLPGSDLWDRGEGDAFAAAAERFLEAGVPVAAICGATAGLARRGLLDQRRHTSASPGYLEATGYAGAGRYVDEPAVADGGLITAGPQAPVQFACRALEQVGVANERTLDAYEALFGRGDLAGYSVLMEAQASA